ncbi:unnamed protein product [Heterobilharzia americana]|nr:unnamed protein product [Heterobilharzia americana]
MDYTYSLFIYIFSHITRFYIIYYKWSEEVNYENNKSINDDLNNPNDLTLNNNQSNNNNKGIIQQISIREPHYILTETEFGKMMNRNGWPIIIIILVVILPLIILSVFNGLLIKSIVNASKIRMKLTKKSNIYLLPQIRYNITCVTDIINSNLIKDNIIPIHRKQHDCYSLDTSIEKNNQKYFMPKNHQLNEIHIETIPISNSIKRKNNFKYINNDISQINTFNYPIKNRYKSSILLKSHSCLSERERITLMLILIVVAFCVLTMPSAVVHLIKVSYSNINKTSIRLNLAIAGNFVNLSLAINSTLNFFFYSWLSRRFRKTFHSLIKCK